MSTGIDLIGAGTAVIIASLAILTVGLWPGRHTIARHLTDLTITVIAALCDATGNTLAWLLDGGRDRAGSSPDTDPAATPDATPPPSRPWELETGEFPKIIARLGGE